MQETQVQSLAREDPLEKEKATHCSILAWENPVDRRACLPIGLHRVRPNRCDLVRTQGKPEAIRLGAKGEAGVKDLGIF